MVVGTAPFPLNEAKSQRQESEGRGRVSQAIQHSRGQHNSLLSSGTASLRKDANKTYPAREKMNLYDGVSPVCPTLSHQQGNNRAHLHGSTHTRKPGKVDLDLRHRRAGKTPGRSPRFGNIRLQHADEAYPSALSNGRCSSHRNCRTRDQGVHHFGNPARHACARRKPKQRCQKHRQLSSDDGSPSPQQTRRGQPRFRDNGCHRHNSRHASADAQTLNERFAEHGCWGF